MPKKAIITGATGLIGEQLLELLANSENYNSVIVLSRREVHYQNSKIQLEVVDFDALDDQADFWQVDDVFCCLGTTMNKAGNKQLFRKVDYHYPLEIAQAAYNNGATAFHLVSALGADTRSSIFYNKTKGEVEEAIKKVNYPKFHIYQPSLLFGDRGEFRLGENVGIFFFKVFSFLMLGPLKKYRGIESGKVANAMFQQAQNDEKGHFIHESLEMQNYES